MYYNKLLLICAWSAFFAFGIPFAATSQTYSSLLKNANESFQKGDFGEAGDQYEKAARLKDNKPETMYKAAECYYRMRNYVKAVECYELVKDEFKKYELAGLRYARSLKQTERYTEAIEAFKNFARRYRGSRKAQVIAVVQNDIKGCELAMQMAAAKTETGTVLALPDGINTSANDFAPIPWSSDLLYYSGYVGKKVSLLRSMREGADWQQADSARGCRNLSPVVLATACFQPTASGFTVPNAMKRRCMNAPATDCGQVVPFMACVSTACAGANRNDCAATSTWPIIPVCTPA